MKKIRNILLTFIIILSNFLYINSVFGANTFSMSITGSDSVTKGNNVALSLNVNPAGVSSGFAGYQGNLTYDATKLEYVNITSSVAKWDVSANPSTGKVTVVGMQGSDLSAPLLTSQTEVAKITFKVLASSGSTTVTFSSIVGSDGDDNSLSASDASKTLTISEGSTPSPKSSDATLSGLGVNGYAISPAFTSGTTTYKVTIPSNVSSIDVIATPNDSKSKVEVTGNTNLKAGKNTVTVTVTAEDGSKKVYTIDVMKESGSTGGGSSTPTPSTPSKKSSNANLKNITGIDGLKFDPYTTDYSIEIPNEISSLNVGATPADSKAKVKVVNGNIKDMVVGQVYPITIVVTAEDGSSKVYTVNVRRGTTKSQTELKKLVINDVIYDTDSGKDTYDVTIPYNKDILDISAIPKSDGATVKIIGNEKLKTGDNKVIIEVTDKNGYTKSYTINVKKESKNKLFDFIDKYWFLLLILPLIVMLTLIYVYFKNERMIRELDASQDDLDEKFAIEKGLRMRNDIDNDDNIVYNSNDRIGTYDKTDLDGIVNDNSISEFEVKIERNGNSTKKYRRR